MYKRFENCKIRLLHWDDKCNTLSFEIVDETRRAYPINIQTNKQRLKEELPEIVSGYRKHGVFSHGMTDINMWPQGKNGVIVEWSPSEVVLLAFHLPVEEFDVLVKWVKNNL